MTADTPDDAAIARLSQGRAVTPEQERADAYLSWAYAVACARARLEAARPLDAAELASRADRIIAEARR